VVFDRARSVIDHPHNNIENFWGILKRGYMGVYHYMSEKHLQRYLAEFTERYNNRKLSAVEKFQTAVKKSSKKKLPYQKLIGKGKK